MTTTEPTQTRKPVTLYLMPVPAGPFGAEAARDWLRQDARSWVSLLGDAMYEKDLQTRAAFAVLALDVELHIEAAVKALEEEAVTFDVFGEDRLDIDFGASIHELARMASARPRGAMFTEHAEYGQSLLRAEMLRRMDALCAGGSKEEDAD